MITKHYYKLWKEKFNFFRFNSNNGYKIKAKFFIFDLVKVNKGSLNNNKSLKN